MEMKTALESIFYEDLEALKPIRDVSLQDFFVWEIELINQTARGDYDQKSVPICLAGPSTDFAIASVSTSTIGTIIVTLWQTAQMTVDGNTIGRR